MQEQTKQAAARGDAAVTPLADLEFIPFLDKDGKLTTVDTKGVKASVYAVYDEAREEFARCWVYVVRVHTDEPFYICVICTALSYTEYVTTRKCAHDNSRLCVIPALFCRA